MAGNKTSRPAVDWERVESEYRAGVLSVREIAAHAGITHGAINKRAAKDGWVRDLGAKIKAKADSIVSTRLVSSEVSSEKRIADRILIEANAEAIANVRLNHRGTIRRSRELVEALLLELESQTMNVDLVEKLEEIIATGDDGIDDKLQAMFRAVSSLPGRTKTMKELADSLQKLVNLERDAYGLNDEVKESDASRGRAERLAAARARLGSNG